MTLNEIAQQQERRMLESFNAVISEIRDGVTLNEIARQLDMGNVEAVLDLLQMDRATWEPMEETLRQAYREGGVTGAQQIGRIPAEAGTLVMRFDVRNLRAEQWIREQSSRLITEMVEGQRTMVRERLAANLARGVNPRTSALDLVGRIDPQTRRRTGGFVGMTSQQAQWSANAREELENLDPNYFTRELRDRRQDARIRRAIANETPLSDKDIDTAITRMQARTQRYRGETISRTETINALRAGQHESVAQAIENGEVTQQDVRKVWDASGDSRTREDHAIADGQSVPFDQPFIVGGEALRYPGDPMGSAGQIINCRCRERVVIDFAGQLKRVEGFR